MLATIDKSVVSAVAQDAVEAFMDRMQIDAFNRHGSYNIRYPVAQIGVLVVQIDVHVQVGYSVYVRLEDPSIRYRSTTLVIASRSAGRPRVGIVQALPPPLTWDTVLRAITAAGEGRIKL